MAGFCFKIAELEREIMAMKTLGKEFLDSETSGALEDLRRDLQSIGEIPKEKIRSLELQCLRTIPSDQYDRKVGRKIYAVITGVWQLRTLGKQEVEFCGKASTKIKLYASDDPDTHLAMWCLELGDEESPGCYVHAHIIRALPIPRLPSLFVTPMSAIEFVLGELFQNKWAQATASRHPDVDYWRARQKKWLQRLFSWYNEQIEKSSSSSWVAIKKAKPADDMFLRKSRMK